MYMKKVAFLMIFLLLIALPVLADIVEITIEYGDTECVESWSCTDWSECHSGTQTKTCTDVNNCGTTLSKPLESQSCEVEEDETEETQQTVTTTSGPGTTSYTPDVTVAVTVTSLTP